MKTKKTKKDLNFEVHQHAVALETMLKHLRNNKSYYYKDQNFESFVDVLLDLSKGIDEKMQQLRGKTAYKF